MESIDPFAVFLDGYHIGSSVFIVGLLVDADGKKHVLGFWEGATENHEICIELFNNLENRGLSLTSKVLFVIDGGKGVIKALKERFGKELIYQRCTVHKDRNIQRHLPKKYRQEAHRRFRNAIDCTSYTDAKEELITLEKWLERINPSAAKSLMECSEELLTVHRLCIPPLSKKNTSFNKSYRVNVPAGEHKHRKNQIHEERKYGPKVGSHSFIGSRKTLSYDKGSLANTGSKR